MRSFHIAAPTAENARTWRHAEDCPFARSHGAPSCTCGLKAMRAWLRLQLKKKP